MHVLCNQYTVVLCHVRAFQNSSDDLKIVLIVAEDDCFSGFKSSLAPLFEGLCRAA